MEMERIQTDKAKLRKASGIKENELSGWMNLKKMKNHKIGRLNIHNLLIKHPIRRKVIIREF